MSIIASHGMSDSCTSLPYTLAAFSSGRETMDQIILKETYTNSTAYIKRDVETTGYIGTLKGMAQGNVF